MKSPAILSKLVLYILSRRPDEYGLVLDPDGFVRTRSLLQAIQEEPGFGYVRMADITHLPLLAQTPIEICEGQIRAVHREHLPGVEPCHNPPKLLYLTVRRKAYGHVLEKGILPSIFSGIVLVQEDTRAVFLGKRQDPDPVLLTVQTREAMARGVEFFQIGSIFYVAALPPGCFTGPPLYRILPAENIGSEAKENIPKTPGSFFLDRIPEPGVGKTSGRGGRKKRIIWKTERKHSNTRNRTSRGEKI